MRPFRDKDKKIDTEESKPSKVWNVTATATFEVDLNFWSTGACNLNFHSGEFEIELLCFGLYIGKL